MREDDYTGVQIEDQDQLSMFAEHGLYEFDPDAEEDASWMPGLDDGETIIQVSTAVEGARTLREAAERLYDFADELLELAGEGWEILDIISGGHGTAVRISTDEDEQVGV